MSSGNDPLISEDTGSALRSTPQKMFGIFVVLLATVTAGVTIGAFVDLQGLEHAESGNLVRAEFIVNETSQDPLDADIHTYYSKFRVESGVLSQSQVRVTRIDGMYAVGSPKNVTEKTCESFTINGPDDTTGWYRLAYEFSFAVGSTPTMLSGNTQKNIFLPGTKPSEPDWPKGAISLLTTNFQDNLDTFVLDNVNESASHLLTPFKNLYSDGKGVYYINTSTGYVLSTTATTTTTTTTITTTTITTTTTTTTTTITTTAARRGRRGLLGVAERGVGGAVHRGRRGSKNNKLCGELAIVQTAKFFYAGVHFHGVDSTPRRGTEALVFTKAVKAMTNALSVVSPTIDVTCFLKQYRDDAHALLMQFEALETFGIVHIASVIVILILAAMVAHMLRSVGTMSLATLMLFIGTSIAYVCYFSWAIGHHVKRVVDAVEEAIPSVQTCGPANGIDVMYDTDAGTTETLYMIVFGMSIAVGACSLALILSKSERGQSGSEWNRF